MRASAVRSRSLLSQLLVALAILTVAGLGLVGSLYALGVELPWTTRKKPAPRPVGVPFPAAGRPIPAYKKVTLTDLLDAKTNEPAIMYLPQAEVERLGIFTHHGQIVGRVLRQDYQPGQAFRESSFFPKGTREGPSAGVPPGKRLFVVEDAEKIMGLSDLRIGDHFDLLAAMSYDPARNQPKGNTIGQAAPPGGDGQLPKRARVQKLVSNGVIVLARRTREVPVSGGQRKAKEPPKTRTVNDVSIAISPDEVVPLSEALAVDADIVAVARSGQPDEHQTPSEIQNSPPEAPPRTMELVVGGRRDLLIFPRQSGAPVVERPEPAPPPALLPSEKAQ